MCFEFSFSFYFFSFSVGYSLFCQGWECHDLDRLQDGVLGEWKCQWGHQLGLSIGGGQSKFLGNRTVLFMCALRCGFLFNLLLLL